MSMDEHLGHLLSGEITCSCGWTSGHYAMASDAATAWVIDHLFPVVGPSDPEMRELLAATSYDDIVCHVAYSNGLDPDTDEGYQSAEYIALSRGLMDTEGYFGQD